MPLQQLCVCSADMTYCHAHQGNYDKCFSPLGSRSVCMAAQLSERSRNFQEHWLLLLLLSSLNRGPTEGWHASAAVRKDGEGEAEVAAGWMGHVTRMGNKVQILFFLSMSCMEGHHASGSEQNVQKRK